jgi:hypothetical protein
MSVSEGHLLAVMARADDYAGWPDCESADALQSRRSLRAALARLVLEVQAALPCYFVFKDADQVDCVVLRARMGDTSTKFCPSCTARRQLAEVPGADG